MGRIKVIKGNIVTLEVDAIVNAANTSLLGGGGVDGAIHRAAGSKLAEECMMLHGCKPGEAKVTGGHKLSARYIIHTVGPVWNGGVLGESEILRRCYENSLVMAAKYSCNTVAFPAISTGIYRYPPHAAAMIAVSTIAAFLKHHDVPATVILCAFDDDMKQIYQNSLTALQDHDV